MVVTALAKGLHRLAEGDLTHRVTDTFADRYMQLRADFNAAVEGLHGAMKVVATNAISLSGGSSEISRAADDLSHRTEQQAAHSRRPRPRSTRSPPR